MKEILARFLLKYRGINIRVRSVTVHDHLLSDEWVVVLQLLYLWGLDRRNSISLTGVAENDQLSSERDLGGGVLKR